MGNMTVKVLVDSGSMVTAMRSQFYQQNKNDLCPKVELPTIKASIRTATGKKCSPIRKQVGLSLSLGNEVLEVVCLLIDDLMVDMILGMDYLRFHQGVIDLQHGFLSLKLGKEECRMEFEKEGNGEISIPSISVISEDAKELELTDETINSVVGKIENLNKEDREKFRNLVKEKRQVFSKKLGRCNAYQYEIDIKEYKDFCGKSYPVPLKMRQKVDEEIERLRKADIIEPGKSDFISPLVPVDKKDGSIRLCLDGRKVNEIIKPDFECVDYVDALFSKCNGAKYFSLLDLSNAFHQIELSEKSRKLAAFKHKGRVWCYKVCPFGLNVSGSALVRGINKIFENEFDEFTIVFVDDILVISKTYEEHLEHLKRIWDRLIQANMTLKFEKAKFFQESISYLGFKISQDGLEPEKEKIRAILEFPSPKKQKDLRSFFGLINFYKRFVHNLSFFMKPLLSLTSSKTKWSWTEQNECDFQTLKTEFLKAVVIHHPDPNKRYYLACDASKYCIAAVLYQKDEDGAPKVVQFINRVLKKHEISYSIQEKELLSIVYALQKSRLFVYNSKLTILTDNQALSFLKQCKLTDSRITRWILLLQEYTFDIVHCPGKENVVADVMSRVYEGCYLNKEPDLYISAVEDEGEEFEFMRDFKKAQEEDEKIKEIKKRFSEGKGLVTQLYSVEGGLLYKKLKAGWKLVCPDSMISDLVTACHLKYIHVGINKTLKILQEDFTWLNMRKTVTNVIRKCLLCQSCKFSNQTCFGESKPIISERKNQMLSIDFVGPLPTSRFGFKYLLVTYDCFTKYTYVYPLKQITAATTINKIFNHYIPNFGRPETIVCDHGSQFTSKEWQSKLEAENIKLVYAPIRHPQSNMVERVNKEVGTCLRIYSNQNHKKWAFFIKHINETFNEIPNDTTGFSPSELHLNKIPSRFWHKFVQNKKSNCDLSYDDKCKKVKEAICFKGGRRAMKFNNSRKLFHFKVGEKVLVKTEAVSSAIKEETKKLHKLYSGPFIIKEKVGRSTYLINNLKGFFHASLLKPFFE